MAGRCRRPVEEFIQIAVHPIVLVVTYRELSQAGDLFLIETERVLPVDQADSTNPTEIVLPIRSLTAELAVPVADTKRSGLVMTWTLPLASWTEIGSPPSAGGQT